MAMTKKKATKKKATPKRGKAKVKPGKKCDPKEACEYIASITSTMTLPPPPGTSPSNLPWLLGFYLGYYDLYKAVVRLEKVAASIDTGAFGPPVLTGGEGDKAGAPPPPQFPPP